MSAQAVSDALPKIDGKGRKVEFLKEQIKIRTVGLGWTDLKVAWSKGGVNKEPEELERDLGKILEEEKDREMPADAPVPSIARKTLKQLGAPIQQFDELQGEQIEIDSGTYKIIEVGPTCKVTLVAGSGTQSILIPRADAVRRLALFLGLAPPQ